MENIPEPLWRRAEAAAEWLRERKAVGQKVTVVHHIDADGVSAGAVALEALSRAGISHDSVAAKSLDDVHVERIQGGGHDALWFCDFGSTAYMHFEGPKLVCDHHELVRDGSEESFPHVNPLLDDLPGDGISGSGCAFLVAVALDADNRDLAPIALLGASGDLQDRRRRDGSQGFHGANAAILQQAEKDGLIELSNDLAWFGLETRPLWKLLNYARDPEIPGITGDRRATFRLLHALGIPDRGAYGDRTWSDLREDEQRRLRDTLLARVRPDELDQTMRQVVRIAAEPPGTPVRELQEFGTLLNSTARYGRPEIGLAVARGDRKDAYQQALGLLHGHRKNLAGALRTLQARGITVARGMQWVHVEDEIMDTVVGIVCGMALDSAAVRDDIPLIGLAYTDDGRTKVSSRAPRAIQGDVDLAEALREAAAGVGGIGGGHRGAAGATIPRDGEQEFLDALDAILVAQLGPRGEGAPRPDSQPASSPRAASAPSFKASGAVQSTLGKLDK